jgi:hypothetical protein
VTIQIGGDNKKIAQVVDRVFGGDLLISEHPDISENQKLFTLSRPQNNNLISFSTVGVSDFQPPGNLKPPLGVELLGVSERNEYGRVLVAAGVYAIRHGWLLSPGTVILGVVAEHMKDLSLPHLLLLEPFLWEDNDFDPLTLSDKTVAWTLGVPISQAEAKYRYDHGFDALEEVFLESQPDFFDLQRPSTVHDGAPLQP